jgi:hypothetical protein
VLDQNKNNIRSDIINVGYARKKKKVENEESTKSLPKYGIITYGVRYLPHTLY